MDSTFQCSAIDGGLNWVLAKHPDLQQNLSQLHVSSNLETLKQCLDDDDICEHSIFHDDFTAMPGS